MIPPLFLMMIAFPLAFFMGAWHTNVGKILILPTFFDQRHLIVITCLLVTPVLLYYFSLSPAIGLHLLRCLFFECKRWFSIFHLFLALNKKSAIIEHASEETEAWQMCWVQNSSSLLRLQRPVAGFLSFTMIKLRELVNFETLFQLFNFFYGDSVA